jgi:hypothetical protein
MSEVLTSLMKVDLLKVPQEVIDGLKSNLMTLSESNGVVYWAAESGRTGIVQHLPMVPVDASDFASAEQLLKLGQAVQSGQAAAVIATAASTAVIVAVVVAATIYLGKKIEKVGAAVAEVQSTLDQQDQREYLTKVNSYMAAVQRANELAHGPRGELSDLLATHINRLAELRAEVIGFVGPLRQLISSPKTSEAQFAAATNFITQVLDLIPLALSVERELCLLAGKPGFAQKVRTVGGATFFAEKEKFQRWSEDQYRQLALGKGFVDTLAAQRTGLTAFLNSPVHSMLINGLSPVVLERAVIDAVDAAANEGDLHRAV